MSKLSLKIIVISLLMSPFNIQAGWCMDEVKESLESAARKAGRIMKNNNNRHPFEEEKLALTLETKSKRGSAEWTCKNCKQLQSNCYGFGGGKSQHIEAMAKELQSLLADMESQK